MKPVRIAQPAYDGNLSDIVCNPRYATVVGLLMEARKHKGEPAAGAGRSHASARSHQAKVDQQASVHATSSRVQSNVNDGSQQSVWAKMKEWFVKTF